MASNLALFGLICSAYYLNSTVLANHMNITPGNDWTTTTSHAQRHRREQNRPRSCGRYRKPKYNIAGFPALTKDDIKVQFVRENNIYSVRFQWATLKVNNGTELRSYFINWYSAYYIVVSCLVLDNMTNTFIIHESERWKNDWELLISIQPDPTGNTDNAPFIPFYPSDYNYSTPEPSEPLPTSLYEESSVKTDSIMTAGINRTSLSISYASSAQMSHKSIANMNAFKLVVVVSVTAALIGIAVIAIAVYIYKRKKRVPLPADTDVPEENNNFYVSYFTKSEPYTAKVVEITTWFRKQGYDVQMDIMQSSINETRLRELGRLRFGNMQLEKAKNVFMIVTPSYLKLCRLDEGETNLENLTKNERIVYSEITHIRNELCSTVYRSSRFIPVLFGVKEIELPFWIKVLVVYSWPDDKLNNRLLYRLNEQLEYTILKKTDKDIWA